MTRHTYLLFALMTFGSLSVSAQMSLGYYKFKDGAEYTGELKGRRPKKHAGTGNSRLFQRRSRRLSPGGRTRSSPRAVT